MYPILELVRDHCEENHMDPWPVCTERLCRESRDLVEDYAEASNTWLLSLVDGIQARTRQDEPLRTEAMAVLQDVGRALGVDDHRLRAIGIDSERGNTVKRPRRPNGSPELPDQIEEGFKA